MTDSEQKLPLDRRARYQIKVPGALDARWSVGNGEMIISVERTDDSSSVTTLTCIVDQAALHGLLRRLYSLGLPLISVICIEGDSEDEE